MPVSEAFLRNLQSLSTANLSVELNSLCNTLRPQFALRTTDVVFPHINAVAKTAVGELLDSVLKREDVSVESACRCIELMRILSRDVNAIDRLVSAQTTDLLSTAAVLLLNNPLQHTISPKCIHFSVILEAQKCLSNALFHSSSVRERFLSSGAFDNLVDRIRKRAELTENVLDIESIHLTPSEAMELFQFDLRLCFLESAQNRRAQDRMRTAETTEALAFLLERHVNRTSSLDNTQHSFLTGELLKLLFNVYCHSTNISQFNQENRQIQERLVRSCVVIVTVSAANEVTGEGRKADDQSQNAINLLATLPPAVVASPCVKSAVVPQMAVTYQGCDMSFPDAVLNLLLCRMDSTNKDEIQLLATYLNVLTYLSERSKETRRYLRLKVFPPLHASDVEERPEEGLSVRNRMVRLMTGSSAARDMAAQFLFVLCKQSVPRLIKYTGFGNAAGLLANNGLLGSINEQPSKSDSEDSDMEDYDLVKNQVNPVVGCIEEPKADPMEGMSEEQKEFEAMKLVDCMHKLMDSGLIRPGIVGEDGRPRPVTHMLELRDTNRQSDTDTDTD